MKIATHLKSIDIFGESVNFNARDQSKTFKTWPGALMTLLFALVVAAYGGKRFIVFINRDDTKFQEAVSLNQFDPEDKPISFEELGISFAFRLSSRDRHI